MKNLSFLDDQEYSFAESLQSLYFALIPDSQYFSTSRTLKQLKSAPYRIQRSLSCERFQNNVFCEFQRYTRYLRSMRRMAIINWSFSIYSTFHSIGEDDLFKEILKISSDFFMLYGREISQNCIENFLKKIKIIQQEIQKRNLKTLNSLAIEIINQIKRLGRVIFCYYLINKEPLIEDQILKTKFRILPRREPKPFTFVTEQLSKICIWKMKKWSLEYKNQKKNKKNMELIMTCKICLNRVFSNVLDAHSEKCCKRAESLKELNSLIKTIQEFFSSLREIKQIFITKTKLDIKFLKFTQRQLYAKDSSSTPINNSENISPFKITNFKTTLSLLAISDILHSETSSQIKKPLRSESEFEEKLEDCRLLRRRTDDIETTNQNFQTTHRSDLAKSNSLRPATVKFHKENSAGLIESPKNSDESLLMSILKQKEKKCEYNEEASLSPEDLMLVPNNSNSGGGFIPLFDSILNGVDNMSESSEPNNIIKQNMDQSNDYKTLLEIEEKKELNDKTSQIIEKTRFILPVIDKSKKYSHQLSCKDHMEKKLSIKKEEKMIRECVMLEEYLRQVHESNFSIISLRNLETCQELLKDIINSLELHNLTQNYEYDNTLLIRDFLIKITKVGKNFLKYNKLSKSYLIHENTHSEKRSNIFSSRMACSLNIDKYRRSKTDSIKNHHLKNDKIQQEQENNSFAFNSYVKNESHVFVDNKPYLLKKKVSDEEHFHFDKPKKEDNDFFEDGIPLKKIEVPNKHLFGFLPKKRNKNKKINSFICPPLQSQPKKIIVSSLLNSKIPGQISRRKFSFDISQKNKEKKKEIHQSLIFLNWKNSDKDDAEYSEKIKDVWNKLNKLFGTSPIDETMGNSEVKENTKTDLVKDEDDLDGLLNDEFLETSSISFMKMKEYYSDSDIPKRSANVDLQIDEKNEISIHDFEILNLIGKGAYGRVYLVRRIKTDDLYAMKVINTMDNMNKNKLASLQTESEIFDLLTSEYVVKAIFKFKHDIFFCFVMEYMHGGDFNHLLQIYGRFDENIARFYIAELVLAVEHLHNVGVVHRDLKPDNILLDSKGHIKLTDFGLSGIAIATLTIIKKCPSYRREEKFHQFISDLNINENIMTFPHEYRFQQPTLMTTRKYSEIKKLYNETTSQQSMFNINKSQHRIMGTPDYIAPEIISGVAGSLNNPSIDWWSLGVILFEFLIGIPPFSDDTIDKIFDNIVNLRVPWDDVAVQENDEEKCSDDKISKSAMDLIKKLLVVDPRERLEVNEIKNHKFFQGIIWTELIQSQPPIQPQPIKKKIESSLKEFNFLEDFPKSSEVISIPKPLNIHQCLEKNIRFDLLHKENQKNAKETLRKLSTCEKFICDQDSSNTEIKQESDSISPTLQRKLDVVL